MSPFFIKKFALALLATAPFTSGASDPIPNSVSNRAATVTPTRELSGDEPDTYPTTISSDQLELVSEGDTNRFIFEGNVTIRGTDLYASCNQMLVTTQRHPPSGRNGTADPENDTGFGEFGAISSIVALGDVFIQQGEREATAGKATILPPEGKVILEESPVIRDPRGVLTGYRMILIEGERRVRIESGPGGARTRAILPDIRDLGMDRPRIDPSPSDE